MLNIIYIKKLVSGLMEYIYQETISGKPATETFLYKLLNGNVDEKVDFYKQALSIYSRTPGNPRNVRVVLEYPKDKTGLPCYVIREPGKTDGPTNSIGKIEGFYPGDNGNYQYSDSRTSNYELMCFSDNMVESIIMSEVLYALLVASTDVMAQRFDTLNFSMKELMANNDLIPVPIFIRSIGLEVSCRELIPGLVNSDLLGKVLFEDAGLEATFLTDPAKMDGLPGAFVLGPPAD